MDTRTKMLVQDCNITSDGTSEGADQCFQILADIERKLVRLIDGLSLLGIKPCFRCQKLFRCSHSGPLFNC